MKRALLLGLFALACASSKEPAAQEPASAPAASAPAASGSSSAPLVNCQTDADCRAFSDYCTGCHCRALSITEPDPVCDGPGVRCLVDPCQEVQIGCSQGLCSAGDFAYQSK
jgi:hypothetical protein